MSTGDDQPDAAEPEPRQASDLGGAGTLGSSGVPQAPSALRRYGPLAGIAAVLLLVVGATVVLGGGNDSDDNEAGGIELDAGYPETVITYEMAEEEDLDVDFGETCDPDTGLVAVPFFFAASCVVGDEDARNPDYSEDDVQGVTEDEITVAIWLPDPNDTAVQLFQQSLGSDATLADIQATYEGLFEIFEQNYETHGRTINLEFIHASGDSLDGTVARADGREAAAKDPFAVLGGPLTAIEWTQELEAEDIICIACAPVQDPKDTTFTIVPEGWQVNVHATNYVTTKLAGKPAEFAGDEDLASQERVFGHLRFADTPDAKEVADELDAMLAAEGVDVAETVIYDLDDMGAVEEQITGALKQFEEAGVTSILTYGEPVFFPGVTYEATAQDYFPEWVLPGTPLIDMNAFARNADPEQWANAFGISYLPPAAAPELNPGNQLYEWYHGELPPAYASMLLYYPQVTAFFAALQIAGPDLDNQTFGQALYAGPPTRRSIYQPSVYFGVDGPFTHPNDPERPDHGGVDDMVELWWDPDAVVTDESGAEAEGAYWYTNGANRFYPDEYTEDIDVFKEEGSILSITEDVIPADQLPPDYPPPSGGG